MSYQLGGKGGTEKVEKIMDGMFCTHTKLSRWLVASTFAYWLSPVTSWKYKSDFDDSI